jgi:TRAP-type C4-dicarboxylate transport system substrate-binding protein
MSKMLLRQVQRRRSGAHPQAAAKESVAKMRELWDAREKASEAKVRAEKGAQVNTVQKQPFIDAMKPVYDRFVTSAPMKDLVARIQAVT